jgi:hypothetical protein
MIIVKIQSTVIKFGTRSVILNAVNELIFDDGDGELASVMVVTVFNCYKQPGHSPAPG